MDAFLDEFCVWMRLFFCLCAAQGEVKGLHFGELRVRLTFSPHFPRLICVVAHLIWNARACLADLTVFCNSSCTGAYENCHPPELSLLQNRFQALQFYGFSVIRKNREALVGIRCVTTKTAQVFIKCSKFLWLRHICYIWHIQVCRGKPPKFSKRGLDRSQMEQPIKKNKFSYFARSRLRLRPQEIWERDNSTQTVRATTRTGRIVTSSNFTKWRPYLGTWYVDISRLFSRPWSALFLQYFRNLSFE